LSRCWLATRSDNLHDDGDLSVQQLVNDRKCDTAARRWNIQWSSANYVIYLLFIITDGRHTHWLQTMAQRSRSQLVKAFFRVEQHTTRKACVPRRTQTEMIVHKKKTKPKAAKMPDCRTYGGAKTGDHYKARRAGCRTLDSRTDIVGNRRFSSLMAIMAQLTIRPCVSREHIRWSF